MRGSRSNNGLVFLWLHVHWCIFWRRSQWRFLWKLVSSWEPCKLLCRVDTLVACEFKLVLQPFSQLATMVFVFFFFPPLLPSFVTLLKYLLFPCETSMEIVKFLTHWLPAGVPLSSTVTQASFCLGGKKTL